MMAEERKMKLAEIERVQRERRISKIVFGNGAARHGMRAETAAMRGGRSDGRRAGGEQERLDGGVGVTSAAARAVQRRAADCVPCVYVGLRCHEKADSRWPL